jgi:preprotein translocase subunit SecA
MDPDADPADWDYNGLAKWAEESFNVRVNSAQLRKMDREQIRESLIEAALEQIERKDCEGIRPFLVKNYARAQLAQWANNKFEVEVKAEDLIGKSVAEATAFLLDQAHKSYEKREAEFPVDYALEQSFQGGGLENIYVSEQLVGWAKAKFGATITGEEIRGTPLPALHKKLVEISAGAQKNIQQEIDRAIDTLPQSAELAAWVSSRLKIPLVPNEFEGEPIEERRKRMQEWGTAFLRMELTELERAVLLQIYDATWKDHLYAMDLLRESIGLRGVAERDPRIEYKKEGSRLFGEFMKGIRDRVTDVIFKVRYQRENVMRSVYGNTTESFQKATGTGVGASPAAQEVRAELAAVSQEGTPVQTEETAEPDQKVATIVNDQPKVGRNDPCPCGSGKKYKQCHGKDAA